MSRIDTDHGPGSIVERQILAAQERGEFRRLAGAGRPLPDLDEPYDPLWWGKKVLRREGFAVVPAALAIRRRVEEVRERLAAMATEERARSVLVELNREIARVNATTVSGPPTAVPLLDVEAELVRWRTARSR